MWALIEQGVMLMHCESTTFSYHNEFHKYMRVERATLEDVFNYLFDCGAEKSLLEKGKKYFHELFKKWDPEHLQLNEDFDDYLNNDGLGNIIREEGLQNLKYG